MIKYSLKYNIKNKQSFDLLVALILNKQIKYSDLTFLGEKYINKLKGRYSKSAEIEYSAHQNFAKAKYDKAYNGFIKAAKLSKNKIDKSRLYRSAATSARAKKDIKEALEMLNLSLKYNKNNANAMTLYKVMLKTKQITSQDIKDKKILDKLGVKY